MGTVAQLSAAPSGSALALEDEPAGAAGAGAGSLAGRPSEPPGRLAAGGNRTRPRPVVGQVEDCPGAALSRQHTAFLSTRFERLDGELAAPGHRGTYAVVQRGDADLGLVAVDGDLGIWFAPLASSFPGGPRENLRQQRQDLDRHGFACSTQGTLAVLYLHCLVAAVEADPLADDPRHRGLRRRGLRVRAGRRPEAEDATGPR